MAVIRNILRASILTASVAGVAMIGVVPAMAVGQQNGAVVQQPQYMPPQYQYPVQQYPQQQYPQQQYPQQQPYGEPVYPQAGVQRAPGYGTYGQPTANQGYATSGTVIPAGTLITITPTQPIQQGQAGSSYSATISDNVMGPNGNVLIPSGSPATLTVTNAVNPNGQSELALALQSVTVNGRTYQVSTSSAQAGGQSGQYPSLGQANALSGSSLGMLGTLVRVLGANQNSTAANSAIANATQGTNGTSALGGLIGQILSREGTVNVPSQSQLTFRLNQPLQLQ